MQAIEISLSHRTDTYVLGQDILTDFYKKEVRVHLEYSVPVWYSSITREQSNSIEKIQRWAASLILDNWTLSYRVKCTILSIEPLFLRRKSIALNFALPSIKNPKHSDLFTKNKTVYKTRNANKLYQETMARTQRFFKSLLLSLTRDLNQYLIQKSRQIGS